MSNRTEPIVRVLVAAGLAVDAVVHQRLAPGMDIAAPDGIGGGNLFRIQGAVAAFAAVLLLVTGRWWAYAIAGLVALSALGPVLLYHFVNVPAIGPIPSMYDPLWSTAKVVSIVAESGAVVLAGVGVALTRPSTPDRASVPDTPGRRS